MHYTEKMKREIAIRDAEIAGLREGIYALRSYLSLPKFHNDTTVQISDIFMRLNDIEVIVDQYKNEM